MGDLLAIREALEKQHGKGFRLSSIALDAGFDVAGVQVGPNTKWHTIAVEGEWDGHWQGGFKLTAEDFERAAFIFNATKNDVLVDYEHASLNPFLGKAPAAAWIDQLQVRKDENGASLVARFKWTDTAAEHIRLKEYRYLSPTINFRTRDRVSGEDIGTSIVSVALTNTPFLDELPEVFLNSALRGLADIAPNERKRPQVNELQLLAVALGLEASTPINDLLSISKGMREEASSFTSVALELGLEDGSSPTQVLDAIRGLKATQISPKDLAALTQRAVDGDVVRVEAAVETAMREGKIVASNKAWAQDFAKRDFGEFERWAKDAPAAVPVVPKKPAKQAAPVQLATGGVPTDDEIKAFMAAHPETAQAAAAAGIGAFSYVKANFEQLQQELG